MGGVQGGIAGNDTLIEFFHLAYYICQESLALFHRNFEFGSRKIKIQLPVLFSKS